MRILSLGVLFGFVAVVAVFALQNERDITVVLFGQALTASVRLVVAAVFLLGMLSGWAVFDLLRRSAAQLFEEAGKKK